MFDPSAELQVATRSSITPIPIRFYPDGMPLIYKTASLGEVSAVCLRPLNLAHFAAAMFWVDALIDRGYPAPTLVLPCLPGARQDRLNAEGDYLFTAKSVANMINARGFRQVYCVDPHSDVMPGLIDRCEVFRVDNVAQLLTGKGYIAMIAPDAGAVKRTQLLCDASDCNTVLVAQKKRDVTDGKLKLDFHAPSDWSPSWYGDEKLPVLPVLVVDDICDGGATFEALGEQLSQFNVVADLYVTHGIFSKGFTGLFKYYRKIYTTDSIVRDTFDRGNVTEFEITERLIAKGRL